MVEVTDEGNGDEDTTEEDELKVLNDKENPEEINEENEEASPEIEEEAD